MPDASAQADEVERANFVDAFCRVATFQGRFSYCLMSIHAVNPHIVEQLTDYNPYSLLLSNMVYGITVMIVTRPCLRPLIPAQRLTFSLLASLSFNYSSILWYQWLAETFEGRSYLLPILGYISGRVMMVHLLAFLYHIDTRCNEPTLRPRRDPVYEAMYL